MLWPPAFYPSVSAPAKAVTVLVHGLNNKPSSMKVLADFLCANGSDVVLVSLSGHTTHGPQMQHVSREGWHHDMQQAYLYARSMIENTASRPLYFLGYSLGALINLDLMTHIPEVKYDKMVLLAPANTLRRRVQLLQPLVTRLLPKSWKIPSLIPKPYRAGTFTPVQAYRVLFEMGTAVESKAYIELHVPTLIIVDPRDEMISLKQLEKMIQQYNLKKWQICILKGHTDKSAAYHHLILDESSAGKANWQTIQHEIKSFLKLAE